MRALILVLALLYLGPLFLPLTSVQEARRAEIVQEAVRFGHWLIPHLNGAPYVTKPPLHTWITGALAFPLGVSEPVLRLPSLLAALAVLLITFRLAEELSGRLAAFLSVLFLLSAPRFYFFAHRVELEMLLALFFVSYLYFGLEYLETGERKTLFLSFLAFSLGLLTKGPFILLALAPPFIYALIRKDRTALKLLHPAGLLLSALPVLLWYLAVYHRLGGGDFSEFVRVDLMGRLATGKRDPFYHYAGALLLGFLPESLLVLRIRAFVRLHLSDPRRIFVLLSWFVPLFLLSFTAAKFSKYLLSLYPFFAVSLALSAAEWFAEREKLLRKVALALSLLLLTGALLAEIQGNALRFSSVKKARPYLSYPRVYFLKRENYLLIFYRGGPIPVLEGPPYPPGIILEETREGFPLRNEGLRLISEIKPFYRRGRVLRIYSSGGSPGPPKG
ncbi:MAG TPA: hypothetical protein ENJ40_02405 [Thermosulfurimonas dismutans]|uniref:Glycosyltransferase RgtA/B/C/D-like domain-containing protein n=1 Tax=Thermosulfurimonas dismutans TaxID=999894 RepID=A0A7C3GE66_9BACT|nr:hypothetical protein [Thermosulfurimonas dismutans]